MRQAAFWSDYGRGACGVLAAACFGFAVAGCSSGMSRFDFPSFNLTATLPSRRGKPISPRPRRCRRCSRGVGLQPARAALARANLPPPGLHAAPAPTPLPPPSGRIVAARRFRRQPRLTPSGSSAEASRPSASRSPRATRSRSCRAATACRSSDHERQQSARRASCRSARS